MDTHSYRVSGRKVRQVVDAQSKALDSLPAVLRGLEARIATSEALTREQDTAIGAMLNRICDMQRAVDAEFFGRTFWQRLRWLVRGV